MSRCAHRCNLLRFYVASFPSSQKTKNSLANSLIGQNYFASKAGEMRVVNRLILKGIKIFYFSKYIKGSEISQERRPHNASPY